MKKAIIILTAALLATSVAAVAQNKVDKQGRRQGHWVRTDKDGSKIYEGDFVDGKESGTFTYYYQDGTVRIRNNYTVPGERCAHEAYDEQGHLLARGEYCKRNRDGKWEFFAADGRKVKEAAYRMGVKDGVHVVFDAKGDTAEVTTWADNHRNGRWWKRIGENGYITATYVGGGIEGKLLEYDDQRQLVREGYYSNGLKHGSNRLFENGQLAVEESWTHGVMGDRKVLLLAPERQMVSIHDMACLAPQGKNKVVVYIKDGTKLIDNESADDLYERVGSELFSYANRKSRVLVSLRCVQGVDKDSEGRDILLMEPQPDFAIFPDEDGMKMVQSLQYDKESPLDKIIER